MRGSAALRTSVTPGGALAGPWVKNPLWRTARAVPSLDLQFADNKSLADAITGQSLVTFTRASSATYVGSDGLIKTATTNLLLRSEEFDNAIWAKANITATSNQTTAPDGSANADLIAGNAGTALKYIYQSYPAATSGAFTFSVFAKAGTESFIVVRITDQGGVNEVRQQFNLSSGAVSGSVVVNGTATTASSSINPVGNGWYQCVVTATFAAFTQLQGNVWLNSYAAVSLTTNFYLWGAQLEQSSTVGEYIPTTSTINSAPRFDHNPTTGESLGLLVEESRTNGIRNNTMVGAVAGTPGTLPTNWIATAATNLSREVIGTGVENGINYIDLRFTGTVTAARIQYIFFEPTSQIAAINGQSWAGSVWLKLAGGSLANITSVVIQADTRDSALVYANTPYGSTISLTSALTRFAASGLATGASVAWVQPFVQFTTAASGSIDITLRIGLPQLEQGAFATSVIPTTTAAATRSADVASITGTNFSSWYRQDEGTVFAESRVQDFTVTNFSRIASLDRGDASANFAAIVRSSALNRVEYSVFVGTGQAVGLQPAITFAAGSTLRSAFVYKTDDFIAAANGTLSPADTLGTVTTAVTTLGVGMQGNGGLPYNGTIRRLTYWPQRLANSTLQAITQ